MSDLIPAPPKIAAVEVVAAQPTDHDRKTLTHMAAVGGNRPVHETAYVIKIRFEEMPPVTSSGWALYVNDQRIPKYWGYKDGIYFKVLDPNFLTQHDGQPIRFSSNGVDFIDTGQKLSVPKHHAALAARPLNLPLQAEVLE